MILRPSRTLLLVAAIASGVATSGCARLRGHQGYMAEETLITAIQPGVDNKESVTNTLGRPTFTGQFNDNDWYYVSRDTRNFGFSRPKPKAQTILRIRFDQAGNVTAVERRGMEQVASIDPMNDKTPTLGRDKSLIEELFGNIGAVGAPGQSAGTADNPR